MLTEMLILKSMEEFMFKCRDVDDEVESDVDEEYGSVDYEEF